MRLLTLSTRLVFGKRYHSKYGAHVGKFCDCQASKAPMVLNQFVVFRFWPSGMGLL